MTYNSCENITGDEKIDCIINQLLIPTAYTTGRNKLTTTNQAVKLKDEDIKISYIKIQASPSNEYTMAIGLGTTNISNADLDEKGYILFPGEDVEFQISNINKLYISGHADDIVNYFAY